MNDVLNNVNPYDFFREKCEIKNIESIQNYYDGWCNSSIAILNTDIMKTNEYRNIVCSSLNYNHMCDETIYHVYSYIKNLKIEVLNDYDISIIIRDGLKDYIIQRPNGLRFLHPIVDDTLSDIIGHVRRIIKEVNRI